MASSKELLLTVPILFELEIEALEVASLLTLYPALIPKMPRAPDSEIAATSLPSVKVWIGS